jgi:hypothetical protein
LQKIGFELQDMKIVEEPMIYVEGNLGYLCTIWSAKVVDTKGTRFLEPQKEPLVFRVTESIGAMMDAETLSGRSGIFTPRPSRLRTVRASRYAAINRRSGWCWKNDP